MRKKLQRKRKRRKQFYSRPRRRTRPRTESNSACEGEDKFGFQSGSDFTLHDFQRFAEQFKKSYFGVKDKIEESNNVGTGQDKKWLPSVDDIEGEYWRIIEQPTDEVEVSEHKILIHVTSKFYLVFLKYSYAN